MTTRFFEYFIAAPEDPPRYTKDDVRQIASFPLSSMEAGIEIDILADGWSCATWSSDYLITCNMWRKFLCLLQLKLKLYLGFKTPHTRIGEA